MGTVIRLWDWLVVRLVTQPAPTLIIRIYDYLVRTLTSPPKPLKIQNVPAWRLNVSTRWQG
jgi:hypothetical protein